MGIWEKLGLVTSCSSCGDTQSLMQCPHCSGTVCQTCIDGLVTRKNWPEWFIGRKITKLEEFKSTIEEYIGKVKAQGGAVHTCKEYINYRWRVVERYFTAMKQKYGKANPYEFK